MMAATRSMAAQRRPLTSSNELEFDLHHIAQHNANTPYQQSPPLQELVHSRPGSTFASPTLLPLQLNHESSDPCLSLGYGDGQYVAPNDVGLGIQYDSCEVPRPAYYSVQSGSYPGIAVSLAVRHSRRRVNLTLLKDMNHVLQDPRPSTPRSTTSDTNTRRTRSGRVLARSDSPHVSKSDRSRSRVGKTLRTRKSKANIRAAAADAAPKLSGPLSELTKDMTDVPIRDIEAWVSRPTSERQKESEGRNGYVTRPMNSFMLYRSAYADRTKAFCTQTNHQVVSKISGESWQLEPEEVRSLYNRFATIERDNHAKAHPSYKFSPSKNGPMAARKKMSGISSDEEDADGDASDADPDWEWRPSHARDRSLSRPVGQSRLTKQQQQPLYNSPEVLPQSHFASYETYPRITWSETQMGKPLPSAMSMPESYPQYHFQHVPAAATGLEHAHQYPPEMFSSATSNLPGYYYPDSNQDFASSPPPALFEQQVDPLLLQYNPHFVDAQSIYAEPKQGFGASFERLQQPSHFEEWMQ